MKVVVGLGNPGRKYAGTRHNVGFDVLSRLQGQCSADAPRSKFDALVSEMSVPPERVLLVAPQTFMNLSGRSVRQALDFYKLTPQDVLVVCDDLNLEAGRLRLRGSGSAGGQKGLQNIIEQLGTQDFARLRIGIGRPPGNQTATAYVLQKFSTTERELMEHAVVKAADAVLLWVRDGINSAMNVVNGPVPGASGAE